MFLAEEMELSMDVKIKSMTNVRIKLQIENADPVNSRDRSAGHNYTACLFVFTVFTESQP